MFNNFVNFLVQRVIWKEKIPLNISNIQTPGNSRNPPNGVIETPKMAAPIVVWVCQEFSKFGIDISEENARYEFLWPSLTM